ncbi:hypothetical protein J4G37_39865, partial [Microvirga sp. 3-52]|nr:hypothetical protein [Microvirga sp. 3-52]
SRLDRVGLSAHQTKQMYRLLAIAKYEDRFVIPTSHKEGHMNAYRSQGTTGYEEMGDYSMGKTQSPYSYAAPISIEDGSCDGCGPVEPAKTGKQIYEENFYGGIWRD